MSKILTKEQLFEGFRGLLTNTLSKYYIYKYLLRKKDKSGMQMRGHFWITILGGFQEYFLLNLSNLFDTGLNAKKCINIHRIIDNFNDEETKIFFRKKLLKNKQTIDNLINWRGNFLAHKNELFVMKIHSLSLKFPLKYGEITNLIKLCIDVVSKKPRDFNPRDATNYKFNYKKLKRDCEQDTKFVFDYGLDTPEYRKIKNKK